MTPEEAIEGYAEFAPRVGAGPEGAWDGVFASEGLGWVFETPVGDIPMGPTPPEEVFEFIEGVTKPWPKDDPRRGLEG